MRHPPPPLGCMYVRQKIEMARRKGRIKISFPLNETISGAKEEPRKCARGMKKRAKRMKPNDGGGKERNVKSRRAGVSSLRGGVNV